MEIVDSNTLEWGEFIDTLLLIGKRYESLKDKKFQEIWSDKLTLLGEVKFYKRVLILNHA
jgi:hypothetical protein